MSFYEMTLKTVSVKTSVVSAAGLELIENNSCEFTLTGSNDFLNKPHCAWEACLCFSFICVWNRRNGCGHSQISNSHLFLCNPLWLAGGEPTSLSCSGMTLAGVSQRRKKTAACVPHTSKLHGTHSWRYFGCRGCEKALVLVRLSSWDTTL